MNRRSALGRLLGFAAAGLFGSKLAEASVATSPKISVRIPDDPNSKRFPCWETEDGEEIIPEFVCLMPDIYDLDTSPEDDITTARSLCSANESTGMCGHYKPYSDGEMPDNRWHTRPILYERFRIKISPFTSFIRTDNTPVENREFAELVKAGHRIIVTEGEAMTPCIRVNPITKHKQLHLPTWRWVLLKGAV